MRFFRVVSLLLLLSLSSCFDCYIFKCSFSVARKEANFYKGQNQIGCFAEITSYEGEDFKRDASNAQSDSTVLRALDFSNKDDVSDLVEQRNRQVSRALVITEYVKLARHQSSIIPKGIGWAFPNLKHFMFTFGILSKLSREDLRQFPMALSFDFQSNKLESLEEDLFTYNTRLMHVVLLDNEITQVSPNIGLFKMNKLFYINMERNRCINEVFYCKDCKDDKLAENLKEFDTKLINECANMEKMRSFAAITKSAIKTIQSAAADQTKSINEMKTHMTQTDQGLDKMNSGLTALQVKVNDQTDNFNKMTEQMTQINGNLLKIQDSINESFEKLLIKLNT